ncbi:uncharacterized protein HMPREF1541_09594 [Cyphellophora europaea CBS 101466]|uniref:Carboxylic ester hydrolase n=1 Tax=Cyphellophora europaea (strain CBS 101466) TaxID=1220924 RepID=W2SAK7_CYPE1|nr:uncharacterized protein HMPREF1541_09594 [Cyphellophora europaea CBS 101466]ETN45761.1 hypothetical protein HMPREF1541_09594 [Cyphellophora europaea CBS 101466]
MLTRLLLLTSIWGAACAPAPPWVEADSSHPLVTVKNGTYAGVHSSTYDQDFFLGIPFAEPPIGDRRFANPAPLAEESWDGTRDATTYSPFCVGYGWASAGYELSEDCLYLNIIRPANVEGPLPLAVWFYGGAWTQGGAPDQRYNLSFIVERSVELGHPIMAASINYRVSVWGFLGSSEVAESGNSNFGLRDQRLGLHWIQENIEAFGGDPSKVTIWGQSAGAASAGYHLLAFDGRDDGLFRNAIMQSGGPLSLDDQSRSTQAVYDNLTIVAGCGDATDTLACLRSAPFEVVNDIVNRTSARGVWTPRIDGDLIARHSSEQLADGSFVHVPIMIGATADEGTPYAPRNINSTEDFRQWLTGTERIPEAFADELVTEYPNNPLLPLSLANLPVDFTPNSSYGAEYRRVVTYVGDALFHAGRRHSARVWAENNLTSYSYYFNAIPAWGSQMDGAAHLAEIPFVMYSLEGVGWEPERVAPFEGKPESYTRLAELVSGDWISFVSEGDPNAWEGREEYDVPDWPVYGDQEGEKLNFVYDANVTSFVEEDNYRLEAIDLIISAMDVYDR